MACYGCEVWLLKREEQRKLLALELDYVICGKVPANRREMWKHKFNWTLNVHSSCMSHPSHGGEIGEKEEDQELRKGVKWNKI